MSSICQLRIGLNPEIVAYRLHGFGSDCAEISRTGHYLYFVQQNIVQRYCILLVRCCTKY